MNERIRELEKLATKTVKCGLNGTSTAESFNRKKFAELIVRECAMLCRQEGENKFNNAWEQVRAKCDAQMILEHFGVEE